MRHYRRNADEDFRRRERRRASDPRQAVGVLLDKLRSGRLGEITLSELEKAPPGMIPVEALDRFLQAAFNKRWLFGLVPFEWEGMEVVLTTSGESPARLLIDMSTGDLNPVFTGPPPHELPRIRIYVNDASIDTDSDEGWE